MVVSIARVLIMLEIALVVAWSSREAGLSMTKIPTLIMKQTTSSTSPRNTKWRHTRVSFVGKAGSQVASSGFYFQKSVDDFKLQIEEITELILRRLMPNPPVSLIDTEESDGVHKGDEVICHYASKENDEFIKLVFDDLVQSHGVSEDAKVDIDFCLNALQKCKFDNSSTIKRVSKGSMVVNKGGGGVYASGGEEATDQYGTVKVGQNKESHNCYKD
ncbi:hypothetical protein Tco_0482211 [Tanacetum coccineum]